MESSGFIVICIIIIVSATVAGALGIGKIEKNIKDMKENQEKIVQALEDIRDHIINS